MKYEMTNAELRKAISATADQLTQKPFQPPIAQSTRTLLEEHLQKLMEIESARAAVVVVEDEPAAS